MQRIAYTLFGSVLYIFVLLFLTTENIYFRFHECTHIDEHTALASEQMLSVAAPCPWPQLGGHCGEFSVSVLQLSFVPGLSGILLLLIRIL
jgi:hypothetical protein